MEIMTTCPACQSTIHGEGAFCTHCGKSIRPNGTNSSGKTAGERNSFSPLVQWCRSVASTAYYLCLLGTIGLFVLICLAPPRIGYAIVQHGENLRSPIGHYFILSHPSSAAIWHEFHKLGLLLKGRPITETDATFTSALDLSRLSVELLIVVGIYIFLFSLKSHFRSGRETFAILTAPALSLRTICAARSQKFWTRLSLISGLTFVFFALLNVIRVNKNELTRHTIFPEDLGVAFQLATDSRDEKLLYFTGFFDAIRGRAPDAAAGLTALRDIYAEDKIDTIESGRKCFKIVSDNIRHHFNDLAPFSTDLLLKHVPIPLTTVKTEVTDVEARIAQIESWKNSNLESLSKTNDLVRIQCLDQLISGLNLYVLTWKRQLRTESHSFFSKTGFLLGDLFIGTPAVLIGLDSIANWFFERSASSSLLFGGKLNEQSDASENSYSCLLEKGL